MPVATPLRKELPPVLKPGARHTLRKRIHLLCFFIFCALPFFNVMRFDIPRQRFYFAGVQLWIGEFGIVFFTMMFLLFVVVGLSMVYGRVYCGYACPQMIFSEAANAAEDKLRRWVTKKFIALPVSQRNLLFRVLLYSVLGVASVGLAFVFISYFVEPRDLLARLSHFDLITSAGVAGAVTTLFTFLDFAFVRQKFCTTLCPYGYLQGMLADKNTLLVQYKDPDHLCVECKKCVRVCHMGIDIRTSPYQMECIHCGECIEACEEIMPRLGRPPVVEYAWGTEGAKLGAQPERSLLYRLGIRDAKRRAVMLVLLFYATGLVVALSMRHAVLVRVSPERATLYASTATGGVANLFRLNVANRSSRTAVVTLRAEGLPPGVLRLDSNPVVVAPDRADVRYFTVEVPAGTSLPAVSHFRFVAEAQPSGDRDEIPMTFLMPQKGNKP